MKKWRQQSLTQTSLLDTVKGRMKMIYDRQGKGVTVISGPKYVNEIKYGQFDLIPPAKLLKSLKGGDQYGRRDF